MLIHSTMIVLLVALVSPSFLGSFYRCHRTGHSTLHLGIEHVVAKSSFSLAAVMIDALRLIVAARRHVFVGRITVPRLAVR